MSMREALNNFEDSLMALVKHKEAMPQKNFTPDEWREWERGKNQVLHEVWSAVTRNRSRETIRKALTDHDSIDIESLKKAIRLTDSPQEDVLAYNQAIDDLHKRGLISGQALPHISGLDIDYVVRAFIKVSDGESFYGDHGCIECFPSSELADGEFTCAYHQAKAYKERMQPPTQGGDDE